MKFSPPNYRCKVREYDDESWKTRIVYANSEAEVEEILGRRDLEVQPGSIQAYDFNAEWLARAQDATEAMVNARTKIDNGELVDAPDWKSGLWGELKEHLQDLYHLKCAYCDEAFTSSSFGDVEHFRPKGAVRDEEGNVVTVQDKNGNTVAHPGYYWLAYEPSNYLPACQRCNQGSAKKDKFPVNGTHAANHTEDLAQEQALLLRPDEDNFDDHLEFLPGPGRTAGIVVAKQVNGRPSAKGLASIQVYKLNKKDLPRARRKEQESARTEFKLAYMAWFNQDDRGHLDRLLAKEDEKLTSFTLARLAAMKAHAALKNIQFPSEGNDPRDAEP